jgi:hypothetical protein
MAIQDFLGEGKSKSRAVKFQELAEGKTQEEKRNLEAQLLKPEKIPAYTHEETKKSQFSQISAHSVRMVFPDDESLELFKKHFKVSEYVELSLGKPGMDKLLAVVQLLENGQITYDQKTKRALVAK